MHLVLEAHAQLINFNSSLKELFPVPVRQQTAHSFAEMRHLNGGTDTLPS